MEEVDRTGKAALGHDRDATFTLIALETDENIVSSILVDVTGGQSPPV